VFERTYALVDKFVQERHASAAVAVVGGPDYCCLHHCGHLAHFPQADPVEPDTVFDLASLTKVVATTTSVLILLERGLLSLQSIVGSFFPNCPGDKRELTVQQLLTHTSGLPQVLIHKEVISLEEAVSYILSMDLAYRPGEQVLYSCLGFILLGAIVEKCAGQALDAFCRAQIFEPLEMGDTCFNPPPEMQTRAAYTEWCPQERVFIQGRVHDENSYGVGGVAGNAGLFSTGPDLAKFCSMILQDGALGQRKILNSQTVQLLFQDYTSHLGESRTLGWMLKGKGACSGGDLISPGSLGHTGFTGTSIWIDLKRKHYLILLTNRVHPSRSNEGILSFRPLFHNSAVCEIPERSRT